MVHYWVQYTIIFHSSLQQKHFCFLKVLTNIRTEENQTKCILCNGENVILILLIINYLQVSCSTIKCMVFSLKLAADLNILTPAQILLVQHNWIYLTTFDMMSRFFHNEPQQTLTDTLQVSGQDQEPHLVQEDYFKRWNTAFAIIQWNFPSEEVILRAEESNSQLRGAKTEVQNIQRTIEEQGRDS